MESHFTQTERAELITDMIGRDVDIGFLMGSGIVTDYFVLKNDVLRVMATCTPTVLMKQRCGPFTVSYLREYMNPFEMFQQSGGKYGLPRPDSSLKALTKSATMQMTMKPTAKERKLTKSGIYSEKCEHLYFGQKLGIYFVFMRHLAWWLVFPASFGLVLGIPMNYPDLVNEAFALSDVGVTLVIDKRTREYLIIGYVVCITIWSQMWFQSWQRCYSATLLSWGVVDFGVKEFSQAVRPQFWGKSIRSPVTGDEGEIYFRWWEYMLRQFLSLLVSAVVMVIVIFLVLAMSAQRPWLASFDQTNLKYWAPYFGYSDLPTFLGDGDLSLSLVGTLNAAQISLMNTIYRPIAQKLTIWENHRTDKDFLRAYCKKTVIFQLLNSYAGLIYFAFGKELLETASWSSSFAPGYNAPLRERTRHLFCPEHTMDDMGDCLMEILNKQLQSMLLVTAGAKNLVELAMPLFKHKLKTCFKKPTKKSKAKIQPSNSVRIEYTQQMQTLLDREMDIEPHGKPQLCFDGSIEEYTEIAVTFGFLVLWGVTWPLAGLLTWLCLLFELYVDQFKILNLVRRPFPKKVIGFGFWEELFSNMLYVAVFMNALMLVMTAKITFVGAFICESALGTCPPVPDSADHPGALYFISEAISFLVYFFGLLVLLHLCRHVLPSEQRAVRTATSRFKHVVERLSEPKVGSFLHQEQELCDFRVAAS